MGTDFGGGFDGTLWKDGEQTQSSGDPNFQPVEEFTDETVTITEEEARKTAEEFLQKIGMSGFEYEDGGLYNERADIRTQINGLENEGYRKEYLFRYMRNIDGVPVIYSSGSKHTEGWQGESYVKKFWSVESVELRINDEGIVGFNYESPIEITETVVEKSSLKSFDEIKEIFETMAVVANAQEGIETTVSVDRVELGYTRISEQDSFDTGLMVPVWEFKGSQTFGDGVKGYSESTILTINAIDGTVIDRELGY